MSRYDGHVPETTVLITGVAGQDGSLLAERLVNEGAHVIGIDRSDADRGGANLLGVRDRLTLVNVDLCDPAAIRQTLEEHRPSVVYHLASMSFIPDSWLHPVPVAQFGPMSTAALLEAIIAVDPTIKFFHAASADIFGHPPESPQNECTPIAPITPYGAAKAFGHFMTCMYRERFQLHASSAILFNHESDRRPLTFVTRKITHSAARIKLGMEAEIRLGNLDAERDWSYAGDFVNAMVLMTSADSPDDFVLASGQTHSVRDVVRIAFSEVGLDWEDVVVTDESFARVNEAERICGDPSKAEQRLGWKREVGFEDLIRQMVRADLARLESS
jgi:GDPmannose 4,6-dehydratase